MERFSDQAVVLSTVDFGEADRIVTLLTRQHGRLSAFAAGARKSKRRFAGALDVGTQLTAQLVSTRGDTCRLDGADVISSFHRLRDDLGLLARALYCLELCRALSADRQPHEALFDGLVSYLHALESRQAGPTSLLKFELDTLALAGFRPHFEACALCQATTGDGPRFAPQHGGIVCSACSHRVPQSIPTHPTVVEALVRLQGGERVPLPVEVRAQSRELLNLFIGHQLGRPLHAVRFMQQVGAD